IKSLERNEIIKSSLWLILVLMTSHTSALTLSFSTLYFDMLYENVVEATAFHLFPGRHSKDRQISVFC
uniref:Uncharacterized protein n=1 Tax=Meleagris gallopavo TaxID=9103 RepID=A0A803YBK3_MELGA